MVDLELHQTTSSGSRGRRGRYPLGSPPKADRISYNQVQVGKQFGWVKIISAERRYTRNWSDLYVLTQCVGCQKTEWMYYANLTKGLSKGCQSCSTAPKLHPKLMKRLTSAKQRCVNPKDPNFPNYGGRGIKFLFESISEAVLYVLQELGPPLDRYQFIDRIDNNSHDMPGNLRYVNPSQSADNRSVSVLPGWNPAEWPYARSTTERYVAKGLSRDQILEKAQEAVFMKRKNWRVIREKLKSLTS